MLLDVPGVAPSRVVTPYTRLSRTTVNGDAMHAGLIVSKIAEWDVQSRFYRLPTSLPVGSRRERV